MAELQLFEPILGQGFARRRHDRAALEGAYPWNTLDPSRYPEALLRRARRSWTEAALQEHCTFLAFGALLQALGEAGAPLSLLSLASRFPGEEVLHVELCARVAAQLGGLAPLRFDPAAVVPARDPSLTARQWASELVVRVCCVGEALSVPLLAGASQAASHPLTRAVLRTLVEDEALHGRLGYLFLEAYAADFSRAERDRLGRAASESLALYTPLWRRLESRVAEGVTSEGFLLAHVHELGWMDSESFRARALEAVDAQVLAPLARFGIRARRP